MCDSALTSFRELVASFRPEEDLLYDVILGVGFSTCLYLYVQGVRTPTLQLSAMQEGDYTYQLTVTDTIGQQATAQVTVIVQPGKFQPCSAGSSVGWSFEP